MRPIASLIAMTALLIGSSLIDSTNCWGYQAALNVGAQAPEFECLNDQGQIWNSSDHIGKRTLVVYFYPSDFSFCGTRQACRYRDHLCELSSHDVDVVAISGDAVEAHRLFQATHTLNFSLLSDGDGEVARKFGVPLREGGKAMIAGAKGQPVINQVGRAVSIPRAFTEANWTFIINQEGRVVYRDTQVSPVKDSQNVLEFIRNLKMNNPNVKDLNMKNPNMK